MKTSRTRKNLYQSCHSILVPFHRSIQSCHHSICHSIVVHFGLVTRPANHLAFWHDSCTPFTVVMVKVRKMRMRTVNSRCSNVNAGMPTLSAQYGSRTPSTNRSPFTSPKTPARYGRNQRRKRPSNHTLMAMVLLFSCIR